MNKIIIIFHFLGLLILSLLMISCEKKQYNWRDDKVIICKVTYPTEYQRKNDDWVNSSGLGQTFVKVSLHKVYDGVPFLFGDSPILKDKNGREFQRAYSSSTLSKKKTVSKLGKPNKNITYSLIYGPIRNENLPCTLYLDKQKIEL